MADRNSDDHKSGYSLSIISAIKDRQSPNESLLEITNPLKVNSQGHAEHIQRKLNKRKSVSCDRISNVKQDSARAFDEKVQSAQSLNSIDATAAIEKCHGTLNRRAIVARNPSGDSKYPNSDCTSSIGGKPKFSFAICSKVLYACSNGDLKQLCSILKEKKELINYAYPFCYRLTCLHVAAKSGDKQMVDYLVHQGADLNAKDDCWRTPLHLSAQANQTAMCLHLIKELGADPTIIDSNGAIFLDYLPFHERMIFPSVSDVDERGTNDTLHRVGSFRAPLSRVRGFFNKKIV